MPDPNPTKEPLFKISIESCSFKNLTMEGLTKKLKLMHELGLVRFYHITEQTGPEPIEQ